MQPNESLAAAVMPFIENRAVAGAVFAVATPDQILAVDAAGFADVAEGRPMATDALFWIASISKPITATALMMLVDEGKVKLDDPVEKHLPEFAGMMVLVEKNETRTVLEPASSPITVRQVLSHTAGMPFMSRIEQRIDTRPLREAAVSYALTPLMHRPGNNWAYSNAGTNTAGRIIEVVSGQPYESFLRDRLFGPLAMRDTTFVPTPAQLERLATIYKGNEQGKSLEAVEISQLAYPLDSPTRYPCPAGGLFSTARDVTVFGQMILAGGRFGGRRYVSEESVHAMTTPQWVWPDKTQGHGYGLAWSSEAGGPREKRAPAGPCGHAGAYGTDLWLDTENGLVLTYMVHRADSSAPPVAASREAFRAAARAAYGKDAVNNKFPDSSTGQAGKRIVAEATGARHAG